MKDLIYRHCDVIGINNHPAIISHLQLVDGIELNERVYVRQKLLPLWVEGESKSYPKQELEWAEQLDYTHKDL